MSNSNVDGRNQSKRADPAAARAGAAAKPAQDWVSTAATIGVIAAGVALFEVALIPGMVLGGAAVLAPRLLPGLGRRLQPLFNSTVRRPAEPEILPLDRPGLKAPLAVLPAKLAIRQAVAKTITFRIIVTALDFTSNYVVLGEIATAAGLSAFALVVGPVFYLVHETAWNYFGPSDSAVDVSFLLPGRRGLTINRALAKTITFRTLATAMDFTTLYVVVGDLATAAGLSAFGFVVGPFVYLGHEMVWDHYGSPKKRR
ncbi:DUF2061 domain-containing protein [Methylocapsa sp. S129]|uniref:DUF2061 domain-containing protein n=1 Tax=Methylocapsa sp. S129 TaxID=1641869 RepID=UPI00131E6883|nr:DUF2061 domain-containing protein [Methylocapsa sp. S129]